MTVSGAVIFLGILYLAASAAPAFYLAPAVMAALIGFLYLSTVSAVANFAKGDAVVRPRYLVYLLLYLIYLVFSAIMSGLSPADIFSYEAIRYDANTFYSFLPFFFFRSGNLRLEKLDRYVSTIAVFACLLYLFTSAAGIPVFESHNAAGGFFMALTAYLAGRAMSVGLKGFRLAFVLLIVALIASDSRGSLLAVVVSVTLIYGWRNWRRTTKLGLLIGVSVYIYILYFAYQTWVHAGEIFLWDYSGFAEVTDQVDLDSFLVGERPGTVLHRLFFLYPMAIHFFLESPWFGIGFTRFDDFPVNLVGVSHWLTVNASEYVNHTDLHAHNSILHIAAETGIIGVILLSKFFIEVFRSFRGHEQSYLAVQSLLITLFIASLTEHRLTTPSQAAPIYMLIGLLYVCRSNKTGKH